MISSLAPHAPAKPAAHLHSRHPSTYNLACRSEAQASGQRAQEEPSKRELAQQLRRANERASAEQQRAHEEDVASLSDRLARMVRTSPR